ncbi:Filament-like plant protein 7 [Heracleum sosnowskyi]|uniref:Filament-like plant protein 7 n=1 Tax=Heracleum sosnowskyi TaxID=360622 RepID=A0AAD8H9W0_9APIA|nr:Filament-like plant protein 7 [Heracleum sosnowskyi]
MHESCILIDEDRGLDFQICRPLLINYSFWFHVLSELLGRHLEMMDHKTWSWKRKSSEKTIAASNEQKASPRGNKEQTLLSDKEELQNELATLKEKLSFVLLECNRIDDFAKYQTEVAKEAVAGREKAEAEARSLKQEAEKAIKQRLAIEDRLVSMDASLKECMQQLRFVREEQEKRIYDAIIKTSREYEEMIILLEERLAETSKRVTMLVAQNTQLSKALIAKEKVIKDLQERRAWSDANFSTLMTKLESAEKENASFKYELRVVERELDIRNEEKEFSRRTAEVTHKKHLESAKKIAKLESECQRLRLLVRKRLPGPAALAKMRFEVDMLAKDPAETRSRKSTSSTFSMDLAVNAPDTPTKRINFLAKQLSEVKEENKTLKEALIVQANNPQLPKNIFNSSTSKFLEVEAQLDESSEGLTVMGLAGNVPAMHEFSLASMPDMDSDGKLSCVESVTSGFISKMEPLGDCKRGSPSSVAVGDSGLSLMDDFVEMEKLAVGSTGKSFRSSDPDGGSIFGGSFEAQSSGCISEATGIEIVPVDHLCDPSVLKKVIQTGKTSNHSPVWVDDIVKVVLEQSRANQKSPDAILEVIKVAVTHDSPSEPCDFVDKSLSHCDGRGCSSLELPNKSSCNMHSPDRLFVDNMPLTDKNNQRFQLDLSESVRKIIKLVEGSSFASSHHNTPDILNAVADCSKSSKVSETSTGYMVRVFQWKESDLSAVLQKFVQICNEILNGNTDVKKFVEELTSSLEWIINHCFSLQDVSSMRDAIKEHFDWDGSQSENDMEDEMINHFPGAHNLHAPLVSNWKCHNNILHMEDELSNTKCVEESIERFQSNVSAKESLRIQSLESEKTIASLRVELEVLSQSKIYIEDQFQNLKSLAEDLDTQLTAARIEISECSEKLSLLEDELDNKNMVCEELEASCLDLQLQIESMKQNETLRCDQNSEERQLQNDLEIISASEKLAECQETIFNLGRQLQAMGSPTAASKVTVASNSMTTMGYKKKSSQRTSLLDKLLAEDSAGRRYPGSPTTKVLCTSSSPTVVDSTSGSTYGLEHKRNSSEMSLKTNDIRHQDVKAAGNSFAIIHSKDISDRGLWKNMLWRLKKSHSKKGPSHMLHNTTT